MMRTFDSTWTLGAKPLGGVVAALLLVSYALGSDSCWRDWASGLGCSSRAAIEVLPLV